MNTLETMYKKNSLMLRIGILALVMICTATLISQNAMAESYTHTITDGDQVLVHTTSATEPQDVLGEAGIVLEDSDLFETEDAENGLNITIIRGMDITVDLCGEAKQFVSYGETVQELLDRNGITLEENSVVSVELDAQVEDGMTIAISDTVVSTEQYTLSIPYEVTYQDTDLLLKGKEVVLTVGQEGQLLCTAEVTYINGVQADSKVISEEVTSKPVTKVIARGTGDGKGKKSAKPIIGDGVIITPDGDVLTYTHVDTYKATSYCRTDIGGEVTSTGTKTRVGVVAVDPRLIPYGTRMFIVTKDGKYIYGVGTAEDCGGDIKKKRLDLFYETDAESRAFGVRDCYVYFLG